MWLTYTLMAVVALLHVGFMVLEMFLWTSESTAAKFGMTPEFAKESATLAANQGLYNLFLAAGLVFALAYRQAELFPAIATFFLGCVIVAGIYGGFTVTNRIFFIQALPAILALAALRFKF